MQINTQPHEENLNRTTNRTNVNLLEKANRQATFRTQTLQQDFLEIRKRNSTSIPQTPVKKNKIKPHSRPATASTKKKETSVTSIDCRVYFLNYNGVWNQTPLRKEDNRIVCLHDLASLSPPKSVFSLAQVHRL